MTTETKKTRNFTYNDWYDCKVFLEIEKSNFNSFNFFEFVELKFFSEDDRIKIIEEKKKIGEPIVNDFFLRYKKNFSQRLKIIKNKSIFFSEELLEINDLLFGISKLNEEGIKTSWGEKYSSKEVLKIRKCASSLKESTLNVSEYDYVLSPNVEDFYNQTICHQTKALLMYHDLVKTFKTEVKDSDVEKMLNSIKINKEPINDFPDIFINGWAQSLFIEISKALYTKYNKLLVSDFDALVFKLKKKGAIKLGVPRKELIIMINKLYPNVTIKLSCFNNRRFSEKKIITFENIWNKYEDKIK